MLSGKSHYSGLEGGDYGWQKLQGMGESLPPPPTESLSVPSSNLLYEAERARRQLLLDGCCPRFSNDIVKVEVAWDLKFRNKYGPEKLYREAHIRQLTGHERVYSEDQKCSENGCAILPNLRRIITIFLA